MEIEIFDWGSFLTIYVDKEFAARIDVGAPDKYKIVTSTGALHDLVLGGLFSAMMKKRYES